MRTDPAYRKITVEEFLAIDFGSDMGVRVGESDVRYPHISIFCGSPLKDGKDKMIFDNPTVVIEVLSPNTSANDQGTKLTEYRAIASVDTIVFVDPVNELTRTVQRPTATSWRDDMYAQPHDVELPALGLAIPHAEMFARD